MRTQIRSLALAAAIVSACLISAVAHGGEASPRVSKALASLETWLGKNRAGWDAYLHLKPLAAEVAKGDAADGTIVDGVIKQLNSQAAGLSLPHFVELRNALVEWSEDLAIAKAPGLPEAAAAAESKFQPVTAEQVAAAKATLQAGVARLDRYLSKSGANGQAWREYLRWDVLSAQLKSLRPTSTNWARSRNA